MITRWYKEDSIEYLVSTTYASGKGYLFEMFFGWRQTKNDSAKFVFSKKDWEHIDTMIDYYYKFTNK